MRLISYNILDGGEGRADPLAEVMLAQRPDIVVVVEADDPGVLERLADRLAMDFVHGPGKSHASAIFSRWPIRESINHALLRGGLSKSFLEATVVSPDQAEWIVGAVHLHAHATEEDETKREAEIAQVLQALQPHREAARPHLLAGDFNSNSPRQIIDPGRCKPRTREEWEKNGGQIPRRVVQRLLDEGYVDTLDAVHPEQAAAGGTFSTQFPGQRVDYILGFGFAADRYAAAWIEQDRLAKYASDHFPIGVELIDGSRS